MHIVKSLYDTLVFGACALLRFVCNKDCCPYLLIFEQGRLEDAKNEDLTRKIESEGGPHLCTRAGRKIWRGSYRGGRLGGIGKGVGGGGSVVCGAYGLC